MLGGEDVECTDSADTPCERNYGVTIFKEEIFLPIGVACEMNDRDENRRPAEAATITETFSPPLTKIVGRVASRGRHEKPPVSVLTLA